ncbi:MAG: aldo/keto reductase [Treponemataceae bacterium]|nr:aldo/keto reductase [Treponemataceae bacterium]MDE7392312.1 aldo/keto reductase [Treponemataceae bacterium]
MQFSSLTDAFTLANGVRVPCIGFGTWQSEDGDEAYNAVTAALQSGYRHIDTAAAYGNEKSVGAAIRDFCREHNVRREDIFLTTKLWNDDHGYEATKAAIKKSLQLLGVSYIDLYLIHWPNPLKFRDCWAQKNAESWQAMEEAYTAGQVKAIGISNFYGRHITELMKTAKVAPMVNQIKLCPGQTQDALVDYCARAGMILEAYSPLGTGGIFSNAFMRELAQKYDRSIAQICIRWSLQRGYLPLPKSVTAERIAENTRVFDFALSDDDCDKIATLTGLEIKPARNPDEAPF